ncbi:hypothetical protein PUR34_00095, partial [Streptomyces sp. JV185]|uniref:DUF6891 domain-containing protein n=1 Tax=Streptomyces sp. JV185 TaxID=858638 RepID=UPI002E7D537E|nr:hypothetical protein [Streptomyces sp. JV185]
RIRVLLRCGYGTVQELSRTAEDHLVKDGVRPVSPAQARQLVERLWLERVEEQRQWSVVTDADRLTRAFARLEQGGNTASEHFACCRTCGLAEIRGAGQED